MQLEISNGCSGNSAHAAVVKIPCDAILGTIIIGVLRLRTNFAPRSSFSAQDDRVVSIPSIPDFSYFAASTYTGMRCTPCAVGANTYQRFSCSTNAKK